MLPRTKNIIGRTPRVNDILKMVNFSLTWPQIIAMALTIGKAAVGVAVVEPAMTIVCHGSRECERPHGGKCACLVGMRSGIRQRRAAPTGSNTGRHLHLRRLARNSLPVYAFSSWFPFPGVFRGHVPELRLLLAWTGVPRRELAAWPDPPAPQVPRR